MLRAIRRSKLVKDIKGAALIYVSVMMALLMGMAGVAIDMSRLATAYTQAQSAVDAAALAAAAQLDGSIHAIERAEQAAEQAVLIANSQQFSKEDNAAVNVQVTLKFMADLPANDDTPISTYTTDSQLAYFVEATSESFTHENLLLPALGVAMSKRYNAVAVAGQDSSICRAVKLAICNPGEFTVTPENDYRNWPGKLIRVKQQGPGSAWAPGNFGYLEPPGAMGATALAEYLAEQDNNNQCVAPGLNTRPGQVNSARESLNTRFDIYGGVKFKIPNGNGNGQPDPRLLYPPAQNVTKGWTPIDPTEPCELEVNTDVDGSGNPVAIGFPVDNDQILNDADKFGTGYWDCETYWDVNHPDDPTMSGLSTIDPVTNPTALTCANNSNLVTRYQIYKWEIMNNKIPGIQTGSVEEGYPECSSSGPGRNDPYDFNTDRRVVSFAIMNCTEEGVVGNSNDNVPGVAYINAFLTQPIAGPSEFDVYLEVIDVFEAGSNSGPLKEYVEIYR